MNTYARTLMTWDKEPQMMQVVEEMSELTKEILKNINRKKDNIAEIIRESADVEILPEQSKCCYNIHQQVEEYKQQKLEKTDQQLDDWSTQK